MSIGEIAFYFGIGVGDLLIATEWAKYGIWEIGIQRPLNKKIIAGLFIGVITMFIGGLVKRFGEFSPSNTVAMIITGAAILWMLFFRYVILPPGLNAFNKARIRTNFWMITGNYAPGENLAEKAELLREFWLAKSAVNMFKKAIKLQLKGSMVRTLDSLKLVHMVTAGNRYNAGVGYEELALLYRMMNMFDKARAELAKSMEITEQLLQKDPENLQYLGLKSLVIFRLAEIDHVQGNIEEARTGYKESLAMDKKLKNREGIRTTEGLLEKI